MSTILLVEDNDDDVVLTQRAFRKANITNRMDVVGTGPAALEYLEKNALPTIVLLDLNLPLLDGITVLQRIRDNEKTRLLPVIILTSSKEERDLIAGYVSGCNSYIVKPVDFDQFCESIKQLGLYWLVLNESPIHEVVKGS
jgi:CheY-like chemotaxis protein